MRIPRRTLSRRLLLSHFFLVILASLHPSTVAIAQGVTTGNLAGIVTDSTGIPIVDANIVAVHVPSGTQYRAVARGSGAYSLPNLRIGGPYRITASRLAVYLAAIKASES